MLSNGRAKISNELSSILLCEKMGWDYFTYLEQPDWFIVGLQIKINLDAEQQRLEAKRSQMKSRK